MPLLKPNHVYTYVDYLEWTEETQVEIIDGELYMQAAPSRRHQEILSELHRQIANYLVGKRCRVYPAPFEVCLETIDIPEQVINVFEPDLSIICDPSKLDDRGCKGAPDWIVEITSPSTARIDKIKKFNKYEAAGVKEYWIIEPEEKIVSVFTLQDNGRYGRPEMYAEDDTIQVKVLDSLQIELDKVFVN